MSKHTPGPWKIFDGWGSSRCTPTIVDSIPDVDGKCVANCICYLSSTNENAFSNAQLIAAAPELLNALEDFVKACNIPGDTNLGVEVEMAFRQADALLEKLKGKV